MDIQTQLLKFDERKRQIEGNTDLSPEGKRKAQAALDREAANYRGQVIGDLRIDWNAWKSKARRNVEAIQQAEAEAAQQWDYSRLNYMSQSVKSAIANTANFTDVAALYEKARQSGDTHTRRVWAELARETVNAKYSQDPDAILFAKNLDNDLDEVLGTPQLQALKAEGQALTNEVRQLADATQAARAFYSSGNTGGPFALPDQFTELSAGVKINNHVIAETLATVTTVELE